jgi:hypothetical protein
VVPEDLAALFAFHGLPAPASSNPAKRGRGRPVDGISRTLDAACIYRELCRRGLSGRQSARAIHDLLGVSRGNLERYQAHPIEPLSEDHDRLDAGYALSKLWPMVRRNWWRLSDEAKATIRPMVPRLLQEDPPPI